MKDPREEMIPIGEIKPHPRNYQGHGEAQVDEVAAEIPQDAAIPGDHEPKGWCPGCEDEGCLTCRPYGGEGADDG